MEAKASPLINLLHLLETAKEFSGSANSFNDSAHPVFTTACLHWSFASGHLWSSLNREAGDYCNVWARLPGRGPPEQIRRVHSLAGLFEILSSASPQQIVNGAEHGNIDPKCRKSAKQ